jgi:hypothetical protein
MQFLNMMNQMKQEPFGDSLSKLDKLQKNICSEHSKTVSHICLNKDCIEKETAELCFMCKPTHPSNHKIYSSIEVYSNWLLTHVKEIEDNNTKSKSQLKYEEIIQKLDEVINSIETGVLDMLKNVRAVVELKAKFMFNDEEVDPLNISDTIKKSILGSLDGDEIHLKHYLKTYSQCLVDFDGYLKKSISIKQKPNDIESITSAAKELQFILLEQMQQNLESFQLELLQCLRSQPKEDYIEELKIPEIDNEIKQKPVKKEEIPIIYDVVLEKEISTSPLEIEETDDQIIKTIELKNSGANRWPLTVFAQSCGIVKFEKVSLTQLAPNETQKIKLVMKSPKRAGKHIVSTKICYVNEAGVTCDIGKPFNLSFNIQSSDVWPQVDKLCDISLVSQDNTYPETIFTDVKEFNVSVTIKNTGLLNFPNGSYLRELNQKVNQTLSKAYLPEVKVGEEFSCNLDVKSEGVPGKYENVWICAFLDKAGLEETIGKCFATYYEVHDEIQWKVNKLKEVFADKPEKDLVEAVKASGKSSIEEIIGSFYV